MNRRYGVLVVSMLLVFLVASCSSDKGNYSSMKYSPSEIGAFFWECLQGKHDNKAFRQILSQKDDKIFFEFPTEHSDTPIMTPVLAVLLLYANDYDANVNRSISDRIKTVLGSDQSAITLSLYGKRNHQKGTDIKLFLVKEEGIWKIRLNDSFSGLTLKRPS